jgi:thiamine-monophosphate kinase
MIDISDGLSTDLSHICDESGVGAQVWEDAIPRATFSKRRVDLRFALHGGDAYELLFTASKRTLVPASIGGVKITAVGEITHHKSIFLLQRNGSRTVLEPQGWEHFQRRPRW